MFQLEFKNVAIIKFEIGTIMNINIMTKYGIFDRTHRINMIIKHFLQTIDNLMTLLYNDEYIG